MEYVAVGGIVAGMVVLYGFAYNIFMGYTMMWDVRAMLFHSEYNNWPLVLGMAIPLVVYGTWPISVWIVKRSKLLFHKNKKLVIEGGEEE